MEALGLTGASSNGETVSQSDTLYVMLHKKRCNISCAPDKSSVIVKSYGHTQLSLQRLLVLALRRRFGLCLDDNREFPITRFNLQFFTGFLVFKEVDK